VPALSALNERLRDDYVADCQKGVDRWNRIIRNAGIHFELKLPHKAFHRRIGTFAQVHVSPDGRVVSEAEFTHRRADWLPTAEDRAFVASLMGPVHEPGKMAGWIAPPARGIDNKPAEFEYVRFA
ncbi:MAG: benzoyl-CoA 2,3-epoxidase subunit BoxB, partial [Rhodospirillales bacterium]